MQKKVKDEPIHEEHAADHVLPEPVAGAEPVAKKKKESESNASCSVVLKDLSSIPLEEAKELSLFTLSHPVQVHPKDKDAVLPPLYGYDLEEKQTKEKLFQACDAWQPQLAPKQTDAGMSEYLSCLRVLSERVVKRSEFCEALAQHGMFAPAVTAFMRLIFCRSNSFSALEKSLVSSELFLVFKFLCPDVQQGKLFEHSRMAFSFLLTKHIPKMNGRADGSFCKVDNIVLVHSSSAEKKLKVRVRLFRHLLLMFFLASSFYSRQYAAERRRSRQRLETYLPKILRNGVLSLSVWWGRKVVYILSLLDEGARHDVDSSNEECRAEGNCQGRKGEKLLLMFVCVVFFKDVTPIELAPCVSSIIDQNNANASYYSQQEGTYCVLH